MTFLAVFLGITGAVALLVAAAPSRYDAVSVVGFAPGPEASENADVVRLAASQAVAAATSRRVLLASETAADVPRGSLSATDVHAELVPETALVELVVSGRDPQVAARLADSLAAATVARVDPDRLRAEVVRGAEVPTSPAAPARGLYAAAGVFAGTLLALGVVLGLEVWRPRVRSAAHLASVLGVPTVADVSAHDLRTAPQDALRMAGLRLARPGAGPAGHPGDDDTHPPGVAVVGTDRVARHTLERVSTGLAGALIVADHQQAARDPSSTTVAPPGGAVRVQAVDHADRSVRALATARAVGLALVVVGEAEPVDAVHRLREDLDAAGVELAGGVLVRGSLPVRPPGS